MRCVSKYMHVRCVRKYMWDVSESTCEISLVPSPFFFRVQGGAQRASRGEEKEGSGIHCLRMCRIFMEFHETVNYTGHSRIFSS